MLFYIDYIYIFFFYFFLYSYSFHPTFLSFRIKCKDINNFFFSLFFIFFLFCTNLCIFFPLLYIYIYREIFSFLFYFIFFFRGGGLHFFNYMINIYQLQVHYRYNLQNSIFLSRFVSRNLIPFFLIRHFFL